MAEFKNLPHIKYDHEKPDYFSIDPMKPIIEEFMTDFRIQEENHIMRAVAGVGISVDKPRLLQALTDARAFYEEGYRAAMNRADVVEVVRCGECIHRGNLQACDGRPLDWYCPNGVRKGNGE